MEILPAIDLLDGKCVRLIQGRYDRVIPYQRDPLEIGRSFRDAGAQWAHVIDLNGARDGRVANLDALRAFVAATGLKVEFGGGVRDETTIRGALQAGAQRVIIGTRALEDAEWFRHVAHLPEFGARLALGLDARLGKLAIHGWTRETQRTAIDVATSVAGWPLAAIVYTDIGRDGLLLGPNIEAIRAVAAMASTPVIAAGGVSELDDIRHLRKLDLAGVVIGRAIYEEALDLPNALRVARGEAP